MGSAQTPNKADRLISQLLLEDADLREVVEEFVDGLNVRVQELRQAHDQLDWEQLVTLAHRLKGAAGSYGYPDISHLCAEMERRFRAHQADDFAAAVNELSEMAAAAHEGLRQFQ
jgi:HPt (histidine-containing phosphotransfer) domain-containing protein